MNTGLPTTWTNISFDRKIYRKDFNKKGDKALWAWGAEFTMSNGEIGRIAKGGNWKDSSDSWVYRSFDFEDKKIMASEVATAKKIFKLYEDKKKQLEDHSTSISLTKWNSAEENRPHAYLDLKKNSILSCDRVLRNSLLIKFEDVAGNFRGIQYIFKDSKGKLVKRFAKNNSVTGHFVRLCGSLSLPVIYIGEGRATMGSVYDSTKDSHACYIATLSAYNLAPVATEIAKVISKSTQVIICSDIDEGRVGYINAVKAARAFNKAGISAFVRPPFFKTERADLKDFNDLYIAEGPESVKKSLFKTSGGTGVIYGGTKNEKTKAPDCIIPLGVRASRFSFLASNCPVLYELSAARLTSGDLRALGQGEKFWIEIASKSIETRFGSREVVDWDGVADVLVRESYNVGHFNEGHLKTHGVYHDNGGIVTNFGDYLVYNGEVKNINYRSLQWNNAYLLCERLPDKNTDFDVDLLKDDELLEIESFFKRSTISCDEQAELLLGALALGHIPSLLKWRPVTWISAEHGSGKTAILSVLADLIPIKFQAEKSSEAFIRNSIQRGAYAVFLDEMDPSQTDPKSARRISDIMTFIRSCTSGSGYVGMATKDQTVKMFSKTHAFFLGGIQPMILQESDRSRYFMVTLSTDKKSFTKQEWSEFEKTVIKRWKTQQYGMRLFKRVSSMLDEIKSKIEKAECILGEMGVDSRGCDQYGALIGGYAGIKGISVTPEMCERYKKTIIDSTANDKDTEKTKAANCLKTLMELPVTPTKTIEVLINEIIEEHNADITKENKKILAGWGISFEIMTSELFITNNTRLSKELREKYGYVNYISLLKTMKGVIDSAGKKRILTNDLSLSSTKHGYSFFYKKDTIPIPRKIKEDYDSKVREETKKENSIFINKYNESLPF